MPVAATTMSTTRTTSTKPLPNQQANELLRKVAGVASRPEARAPDEANRLLRLAAGAPPDQPSQEQAKPKPEHVSTDARAGTGMPPEPHQWPKPDANELLRRVVRSRRIEGV